MPHKARSAKSGKMMKKPAHGEDGEEAQGQAEVTLTDAGWPRPIVGGYPIPWISPADDLSFMDNDRMERCATGAVCAVCGLPHEAGAPVYMLVKARTAPASLACVEVEAMDNGLMHRKCAQLALGRCPKLRELDAAGELQVVCSRTGHVRVRRYSGRLQAVIDGADCEVVGRADM